ncbi:MAG: hypothetical protein CM1200mP38_2980 [Dehalococcoidia bacterium]|nr:MAG: hypothetical protein CM1200mP38_2980 [Dehalococcoidia bacterium]
MVEKVSVIESIPEMMRRSFSQLRMGRPSPVLLEVPSDILRGEIPNGMNLDYSPVSKILSSGDPNDVKIAAKMLLGAKRPIIQAGQGVCMLMHQISC